MGGGASRSHNSKTIDLGIDAVALSESTGLSREEINGFVRQFAVHTDKGKVAMTKLQFLRFLRCAKYHSNTLGMEQLFHLMDADDNGQIDVKEFILAAMQDLSHLPRNVLLERSFQFYNVSKSPRGIKKQDMARMFIFLTQVVEITEVGTSYTQDDTDKFTLLGDDQLGELAKNYLDGLIFSRVEMEGVATFSEYVAATERAPVLVEAPYRALDSAVRSIANLEDKAM
eukprot:PhM_4_TR2039/c0_g2_i1/m.14266